MAATLQSILGNGVTLPHGLLPDDTTVIYDKNGKPKTEKDLNDPDDEIGDDWRRFDRYVALALAHYNAKHNTDYKAVKFEEGESSLLERDLENEIIWICRFNVVLTTTVGCPCVVAKFFEAEFRAKQGKGYDIEEEVFTSCCMLKAPKTTTACKLCDISACEDSMNRTNSEEDVPPPYSQYLADGVSLSDKAKLRVEFPLLALAYYNKKHGFSNST